MKISCARCGVDDEDLRTLHMSCFYDMSELKSIPLVPSMVKGKSYEHLGYEESRLCEGMKTPVFSKKSSSKNYVDRIFYTLRVCKSCRASWMMSLEKWFTSIDSKSSPGTGIFVRKLGGIEEITEEEFNRRRQGI